MGGQAKAAALLEVHEIQRESRDIFAQSHRARTDYRLCDDDGRGGGGYFYRLGAASLGASEAYSAWAAAMPSPTAIFRIPVPLDPGKQVFYYILLHYFTASLG